MTDLFGNPASPSAPPPADPPGYHTAFDGIIGHRGPARILTTALNAGRVPHAYLFTGPPGIGKADMAEQLARALLCGANGPRPCGRCADCNRIAHGNAFNLQRIVPDGSQIKIEQIRTMTELMTTGPDRGVVIIGPAEAMRDQPANALLKTLEEPPPGWTMILLAASTEALLPTIRSRCQVVTFNRLSDRDTEQVLTAAGVAPDHLPLMTRLAQGAPKALLATGMEPEELAEEYRAVVGVLDTEGLKSPKWIVSAAETWGRDADTTRRFLSWAQVWVSEGLYQAHGATGRGEAGAGRWAAGLRPDTLPSVAEKLETAFRLLDRNVSRQTLIEDVLIMLKQGTP